MTAKPFHGGNPPKTGVIDFSSNLHPEPPPEAVVQGALQGVLESVSYPEPDARSLRKMLADKYEIRAEQVVLSPGSSALLYHVFSILRPKTAVIPIPCFSEYPYVASVFGAQPVFCPADAEKEWQWPLPPAFPQGACAVFSNPCNPTGRLAPEECLDRWIFAARKAQGWIVLDEAYADFAQNYSSMAGGALPHPEVIVLRSPAKFFSLPGLRIGLGLFPKDLAVRVEEILPPWPISSPAIGALKAMEELDPQVVGDRRRRVWTWAASFQKALRSVQGLTVFPTDMHYFLARLPEKGPAALELSEELLKQSIWIRTPAGMPGLTERDFRISTRLPEENGKLVHALNAVLSRQTVSAVNSSPLEGEAGRGG